MSPPLWITPSMVRNTAFDELKADGTMQTLADKYGLTLAD